MPAPYVAGEIFVKRWLYINQESAKASLFMRDSILQHV